MARQCLTSSLLVLAGETLSFCIFFELQWWPHWFFLSFIFELVKSDRSSVYFRAKSHPNPPCFLHVSPCVFHGSGGWNSWNPYRMGPPRGWILWLVLDMTIVHGFYKLTNITGGAPSCSFPQRPPTPAASSPAAALRRLEPLVAQQPQPRCGSTAGGVSSLVTGDPWWFLFHPQWGLPWALIPPRKMHVFTHGRWWFHPRKLRNFGYLTIVE